MIKGIGVDIVEVARIAAMNQEALATKILQPEEQKHYFSLPNEHSKLEFLASRFCAKEACFKALTTVMKEPFYKIEIIKNKEGVPSGVYKEHYVLLSISHENNYVIAYAIYEN